MKPNKFSAIKTTCAAGHLHDSKMEAGRCNDLHALEEQGAITHLDQQPQFRVEINGRPICTYIADFAYFVSDCRIVEDVKGMTTPVFNLKKKLVEASHPGTVITVYPPRKRKVRKTAKRKAA